VRRNGDPPGSPAFDGVVLAVGDVDAALVVGHHAVADRTLVALVDHGGGDRVLVDVSVERCGGRDAEQPAARERAVVEPAAVGRNRDPVRAHRHRCGRAVVGPLHELLALHHHPEIRRH
jgi:hypothetical protein